MIDDHRHQHSTVDHVEPGVDRQVWLIATALLIGALAVVFDTTIVSIAIHALGSALGASVAEIQWVSTAYLLAMFATIPVAGWAQARFGGKRLWLAALMIFLLGSVLCALAWSPVSLITFRAVQGIGGGIILPLVSTLLIQAAHGQNLGQVMSVISLPTALGPILGPVLGGLILHSLSWHWLFLVNVPFCVAGAILAIKFLPADVGRRGARLDGVGLGLLAPGVLALIYACTRVPDAGGFLTTEVLVPLLAGVALVGGFAWRSLRRGPASLIDIRLFRHRPLAASSTLSFLTGAALYGAMLLLPLYWQQVRGEDVLTTALLLIPQGVGALGARFLAGRLTDGYGPRRVALFGFAILAVGTVPFAFVGADTSNWLLGAVLLVRGFGLGAVTIPLASAAFIGLERTEVPQASIISRISQQLGGSFGVALFAVILQAASSGTPAGTASAFDTAFWWATATTIAAIPLCLLLPGRTAKAARA